MEKTRIAFMGLGTMGHGMAARLLEAGYPLTVYNRTRAKADDLAAHGAIVAGSPAQAAAGAGVILSIVSDDAASRQVWLGENGALASAAHDAVLVESSTVTVGWVEELDAAARARGLSLIDAPVTGTKPEAESGNVTFLAGGSETALARIAPALRVMGKAITHLGPIGAGTRMKLIHNFMVATEAAITAQAVGLIETSGLDSKQALEVLTAGDPGSPMIRYAAERMASRKYTPAFFTARLMAKDLRNVLDLAKRSHVELDTAAAALKLFEASAAGGCGEEDLTVVAELYREKQARR